MPYDPGTVSKLVWDRLASHAEGQAVRDALGAGAGSVIEADDLDRRSEPGQGVPAPSLADLPARPFVALRKNGTATSARIEQRPTYTWWIYDDIAEGYWRIEQIAGLIIQAYAVPLPALARGGVVGDCSAGDQSGDRIDNLLGLCQSSIRVYVTAG